MGDVGGLKVILLRSQEKENQATGNFGKVHLCWKVAKYMVKCSGVLLKVEFISKKIR